MTEHEQDLPKHVNVKAQVVRVNVLTTQTLPAKLKGRRDPPEAPV